MMFWLVMKLLVIIAFNRPTFPPIELTDLPRVVSDLHENDDAGFTQEYRVSWRTQSLI